MQPDYILQEVLLFVHTHFARKQFCFARKQFCIIKNNIKKSAPLKEQLEEACWNGLLPETVSKWLCDKKLFTWQVSSGSHIIYIHTGNIPAAPDPSRSINPDKFISSVTHI